MSLRADLVQANSTTILWRDMSNWVFQTQTNGFDFPGYGIGNYPEKKENYALLNMQLIIIENYYI